MKFRIGCFGDVVGKSGVAALRRALQGIKEEYALSLVIVNGENAAGGLGIDYDSIKDILKYGADIVTLGDHALQKKEGAEVVEQYKNVCVRPYNLPKGTPGGGATVWRSKEGVSVGVANVLGRVFMGIYPACPFDAVDEIFSQHFHEVDLSVIDLHAEATSEKQGVARYVDGRATLVFGTHTHVPTADEGLLPQGTAFISDIGMCGPEESVIGMDIDVALYRMRTQRPASYKVGKGDAFINGIVCECNLTTKKATSIQRIQRKVKL